MGKHGWARGVGGVPALPSPSRATPCDYDIDGRIARPRSPFRECGRCGSTSMRSGYASAAGSSWRQVGDAVPAARRPPRSRQAVEPSLPASSTITASSQFCYLAFKHVPCRLAQVIDGLLSRILAGCIDLGRRRRATLDVGRPRSRLRVELSSRAVIVVVAAELQGGGRRQPLPADDEARHQSFRG
jgi:hypothetical protein